VGRRPARLRRVHRRPEAARLRPVLRRRDTGGDPDLDETLYYCNDANMNVTALVSTSGTVVERYLYDPYGKATTLHGVRDSTGTATTEWNMRSSNTFQNAILYCGYFFDDETGLYHVRHRSYHPTLGRWISRDPAGYTSGMERQEYVSSNPVAHGDASGLLQHELKVEPVDGSAELAQRNMDERRSGRDTLTDGITKVLTDTVSIRGDFDAQTNCCTLYGYAAILTAVRADLPTEAESVGETQFDSCHDRMTTESSLDAEADLRSPIENKGGGQRSRVKCGMNTKEAAKAHEKTHYDQEYNHIYDAFKQVDPTLGKPFHTTKQGCDDVAAGRTRGFQQAYQNVKNAIQHGEEGKWQAHLDKEDNQAYTVSEGALQQTADKVRAKKEKSRN